MISHGLRTVSSSHFGPENDQALFFIVREEEIPGSVVSCASQGLPEGIEWVHCQRLGASDVLQEMQSGYVDLLKGLPALVC